MKFGFVASGGSTDQILEMAVAAETAGWDGFFTWDGISIGEGDTFDPWALLGALATKTSTMTLGAMVFPLSRRRPWKVAREAITIDHLSHGRLVLPVGLGAIDDGGFSKVSGETTDRKQRAELLDETLEILELAWRGEAFSYAGKHYTATDLLFRPQPVQQPRIPIWVVAAFPSDKSMNRAIRWDGVIPSLRIRPFGPIEPGELAEISQWIAAHRPETDRPFEIVLEGVTPGDDPAAASAQVQPLADAGATWWIESRWEAPHNTPEALLARIKQGPPSI
jgi:alkanesulfonate monooxygenase SsuD/methylene tetrahydromethanopterin reductase-like flavin-dependent oxidoreductase (luciferase family)